MNCPTCQSENTQRLQIIYESGTQNISLSSSSFGQTYGPGGAPSTVTTTTTGTSVSQLASKCSPPLKSNSFSAVTLGIVSTFVWMFSNSFSNPWAMKVLALGGFGVAVFLYQRARAYNSTQWPPLYEIWKRSWHCNRCGAIYTP